MKQEIINISKGESTISIPKQIKTRIIDELDKINEYPDFSQDEIKQALAKYNSVNKENIICANGSDALIELVIKSTAVKGDNIITANPSFYVYSSAAKMFGVETQFIDLDYEFRLDTDKVLVSVNAKTKAIFIASPNNPTSNYMLNKQGIIKLLENFEGLVVIDECYFELGEITVVDLINKYTNLIVLRSFSKAFALAGLRLGYAISSIDNIARLKEFQENTQPFEVNRLALVAAAEALKLKSNIFNEFNKIKSLFIEKLKQNKIKVIDSKTTFVLVELNQSKFESSEVVSKLAKQDVITKDISMRFPRMKSYLYLATPKLEQIDYVVKTLSDILEAKK